MFKIKKILNTDLSKSSQFSRISLYTTESVYTLFLPHHWWGWLKQSRSSVLNSCHTPRPCLPCRCWWNPDLSQTAISLSKSKLLLIYIRTAIKLNEWVKWVVDNPKAWFLAPQNHCQPSLLFLNFLNILHLSFLRIRCWSVDWRWAWFLPSRFRHLHFLSGTYGKQETRPPRTRNAQKKVRRRTTCLQLKKVTVNANTGHLVYTPNGQQAKWSTL